jgi:hypothetical protein
VPPTPASISVVSARAPERTPERTQRYEELAERIIALAKDNGDGVAFGSYVREQVVRRSRGWKNLNMWLRTKLRANLFLQALASKDVYAVQHSYFIAPPSEFRADDSGPYGNLMPFECMELTVRHKLTGTALCVSIAVASYFPCNDFDVNRLTWDGRALGGYRTEEAAYQSAEIAALRARVLAGEAIMNEVFPDFSRGLRNDHAARRVRALIERGYRVTAPAEFLPLGYSPTAPSASSAASLSSSSSSSPPPKPPTEERKAAVVSPTF